MAGALPPALARMGHRVTLVLPRYRGIDTADLRPVAADVPFGANHYPVRFFERPMGETSRRCSWTRRISSIATGSTDSAAGDYADNGFRFAVLSRGALEYARLRKFRPSVVHAHDWQAALVPVYLRTVLNADPVLGGVPSVLTIHNLAFQGLFGPDILPWIGLGPDLFAWTRSSSGVGSAT